MSEVGDVKGGIEALLFDLGGVIFEIDFGGALAVWSAHSGEREEVIGEKFRFDISYERHERGEIDASQYFQSLRSLLRIDLTDAKFAEGWNSIYGPELEIVERLPGLLAGRMPVFAFTNSNPTHQAAWEQRYSRALSIFQRIFVSSEMGVRKPEPRSYEAVSRQLGIPLDKMVFFDDTLVNVHGARAVGMPAVHVRTVGDVERSVIELIG